MFSLAFSMMKRNVRSLVPAGIAILIGSLFISATFLLSSSLERSFENQVAVSFASANYIVTANSKSTIGSLHYSGISSMDSVKAVRAETGSNVQIHADGKNASPVAIPMGTSSSIMPLTLSQGKWPNTANEVAIGKNVASTLGVKLGDSITLSNAPVVSKGTDIFTSSAKIAGIVEDTQHIYATESGVIVMRPADFALFSSAEAATNNLTFENTAAYSMYVEITGNAEQQNAAVEKISALLGKNYTITSKQQYAATRMKQISAGNTLFPLIFGCLALFVAALVTANTFQVLVAQHRRQYALLRSIGATKDQVYGLVVLEAFTTALLWSVLAVFIACALIGGLSITHVTIPGLSVLGGDSAQLYFIPGWTSSMIPIASAVVITTLSSIPAARAATRVSPVEAMRPAEDAEEKKSYRIRIIFAAVLMLITIAGSVWCVYEINDLAARIAADPTTYDSSATIILSAMAFAALGSVALLISSPVWFSRVMAMIGNIVSHTGPSARIAAGNIAKNARRVAATGTALFIGVTLVTVVGVGAHVVKDSAAALLDSKYSVDAIISGANVNDDLVSQASSDKSVSAHTLVQEVQASLSTTTKSGRTVQKDIRVVLVDPDAISSVVRAPIDVTALKNGKAITSNNFTGFDVSNSAETTAKLSFYTAQSDQGNDLTSPVSVSVMKGYFKGATSGGFIMMSQDALSAQTLKTLQKSDELWMRVRDTTNGSEFVGRMSTLLNSYENTWITGPVASRSTWEKQVNIMMIVLMALLGVAVLVALVGVMNTLSLSVIERTRESATLRAVGMTRGQLRASLAIEASIIAVGAAISAIVWGTLCAWLGCTVVLKTSIPVIFSPDWSLYAVILIVSIAAALLASVIPARRAANTPPVQALAQL